jgi:hypothetical protein
LHELPYKETPLSKIDFESEQVQRATWTEVRGVVLNAMVEAVARARTAVPTEDPREIAVRDGMILHQLHVVLADCLGEVEGKILRVSMRTDEDLVAMRQEHVEAGRARGTGIAKT